MGPKSLKSALTVGELYPACNDVHQHNTGADCEYELRDDSEDATEQRVTRDQQRDQKQEKRRSFEQNDETGEGKNLCSNLG